MERASLGEVELAYETAGEAGGRKAIIIHGLTVSGQVWRRSAEVLARAGWRTLAADNPGHGGSSAPDDPGLYEGPRVADLLHELAGRLDFAPAVVIGHSWGGLIAEEYAIRHPRAVSALVLVDSGGGGPRAYPPREASVQALYDRQPELALSQGMAAVWDYHQAHGLWASAAHLPPEAQARMKERFCRVSPQGFIFGDRGFLTRRDPLPDLAKLTAKTLVICGENEEASLAETSRQLAATIPGARLEVIPRAGHSPHIENRRRFNAVLLDFLSGV